MRVSRKKTVIAAAATCAIIAGITRAIPPSKVVPYLLDTNPLYFGLACLANFATIALRARRWQVITSRLVSISYREVFRIYTLSLAVNSTVPLRAGEAMRSYALSAEHRISKREAASTVLVDRSFDVVCFGLLLLVATFLFELPSVLHTKTSSLAISSIALAVSFPVVARLGRTIRYMPEEKFSSRLQRTIALKLEPLSRGYAALTPRVTAGSIIYSICAWMVQVLVAWLAARSLGVDIPVGALAVAVFAVNAASAIPLTPANVGVFQVTFLFALSTYGITQGSSFAVATVFQAALVLPLLAVALVLLIEKRRRAKRV